MQCSGSWKVGYSSFSLLLWALDNGVCHRPRRKLDPQIRRIQAFRELWNPAWEVRSWNARVSGAIRQRLRRQERILESNTQVLRSKQNRESEICGHVELSSRGMWDKVYNSVSANKQTKLLSSFCWGRSHSLFACCSGPENKGWWWWGYNGILKWLCWTRVLVMISITWYRPPSCYLFSPVLLLYNWQIKLYIFRVCHMMI